MSEHHDKVKAEIHSNIEKIKKDLGNAKGATELAGVLAIYERVMSKIDHPSNTPSRPGQPPKRVS